MTKLGKNAWDLRFFLLTKPNSGEQIKNDLYRACGMYWGEENI
jgi:hypothetical protein